MALNLDAIRKKVAQLNGERGNLDGPKVWKGYGVLGEHRLRIVPWTDLPEGEVFKERLVYFKIGKSWITSPKSFGKHDPIDEFAKALWQSGTPEDKALAKKLFPQLKICAAVIDRNAEDEGVQLFIMDKRQAADVLGFCLDADYGDVTDIHAGYDLKLKVKETDKVWNGKKVKEMKIECSPKPSPLSSDAKKVELWTSSLPDVDSYYKQKTTEEIKTQFEDWLNNGGAAAALADDVSKDSDGTERGAAAAGNSALDKLADSVNEEKAEPKAAAKSDKKKGQKASVEQELTETFDAINELEDME